MIPDLNWWGRLVGLLAVEAALIVAVAALLARWAGRPQVRRVVWHSCLIATALVWLGELAGIRGKLAELRPARPTERTLAVRLVDAPADESLAEPLPAEPLSLPPAADVQPAANVLPQPVWWPGWLWLAGLTALAGRLVLTRAGLAWCVFKTRCGRVGPSFREHGGNCGARQRASVLECVRLAAAFVRRMRTRDVTACVHSRKAVAPLRCATALQDARAPLPASSSAFALLEPSGTEAIVAQLRRRLGLGPVRLQVWPQLRGPVAFGIFRPTVALPADFAARFTPQQREAMLAHELAHLAGRDPLWLALADIVCALAWWHPLVWWARRRLRAASEASADEASALVPDGPAALAESLITFGRELTSPGPARGLGVSGSGLKSELARRVTALVRPGIVWHQLNPIWRWSIRALAVLTSGLLAIAPWSLTGLGEPPVAIFAQAVGKVDNPPSPTSSGTEPSSSTSPSTNWVTHRFQLDPIPFLARALASATNPTQIPSKPDATEVKASGRTSFSESERAESYMRVVRGFIRSQGVPLPEPGWTSPDFTPDELFISSLSDEPALFFNAKTGALVVRHSEDNLTTLKRIIKEFETSASLPPVMQKRYEAALRAAAKAAMDHRAAVEVFGEGSREGKATDEHLQKIKNTVSAFESLLVGATKLPPMISKYGEQNEWVKENQRARDDLVWRIEDAYKSWQEDSSEVPEISGREQFPGGSSLKPPTRSEKIADLLRDLAGSERNLAELRKNLGDNAPQTLASLDRREVANERLKDQGITLSHDDMETVLKIEQELNAVTERIVEWPQRQTSTAKQPQRNATPTQLRVEGGIRQQERDDLFAKMFALQHELAKVANRLDAGVGEASSTITLQISFAEITEGSDDDIGLDWLFGQSPTNNPALQSGPAGTLLTQTNAPKGRNVRVDLLRSEGQSATLSAAQFAALRARLESRAGVDFLTAPKVTARSGQQAQVAVSQIRTLVTGVQATNGTAAAPAGVNYLTEDVPVGPVVDVVPTAEGAAWRIRINASLTEFLGYDDPGGEASVSGPGAKPVTYQQPLPRLRVRALEATPVAAAGETVALRGPLVVDTKKTKGGLFRRERTETTRKRLYVFVTPQ